VLWAKESFPKQLSLNLPHFERESVALILLREVVFDAIPITAKRIPMCATKSLFRKIFFERGGKLGSLYKKGEANLVQYVQSE